MLRRRRIKQTQSLEELRMVAASLPPSPTRDAVLRKARQDETAVHMTEWLNSPGLKPPT